MARNYTCDNPKCCNAVPSGSTPPYIVSRTESTPYTSGCSWIIRSTEDRLTGDFPVGRYDACSLVCACDIVLNRK